MIAVARNPARHRGGRDTRRGAVVLALLLGTWGAGSDHAGAGLPRVFFTPAERAALRADRMAGRHQEGRGTEPAAAPAAPAAAEDAAATVVTPGPARPLRVEGVTLGGGAARAVWIGGERIRDGARWRGYRVQVTGDGARLVAADGSVRHVRVGMEVWR